jgi:hypothetical protein
MAKTDVPGSNVDGGAENAPTGLELALRWAGIAVRWLVRVFTLIGVTWGPGAGAYALARASFVASRDAGGGLDAIHVEAASGIAQIEVYLATREARS